MVTERRHTPTDAESLDLLSRNVGELAEILLPQVIMLGSTVGEIKAELRNIREIAERALQVSEEAANRSTETRALIEEHLSEWPDWQKIITIFEKERNDRQFWARVRSTAKAAIMWIVAFVVGLIGLLLTVENGWQHVKGWLR